MGGNRVLDEVRPHVWKQLLGHVHTEAGSFELLLRQDGVNEQVVGVDCQEDVV